MTTSDKYTTPLPWSLVTDPEKVGEGWMICNGGDWVIESIGRKGDEMGDPMADSEYIHRACHAYPALVAVLEDWYAMFRPVLRPGTEGEALLERTAEALGIEL